jgi:nitrate reductase (NAD(P)H)
MEHTMNQAQRLRSKMEQKLDALPPSPPATDDSGSEKSIQGETSDVPFPPPSSNPTTILDIDKSTPDSLVPRDPRLVRLTGIHPFNVEAPLSALFDEGFLTSPELFYVRNHGYVPHVIDEEIPNWEFSVEGLVQNPITMTLRQLMTDYEQVTCPVTLVCAGNRRKEQNVVRKSKGFSWGAAGVSTALFTGVIMSDIINRAKPSRGAKYVCMEGADNLPNGYYGTCVKLNWVMDPNRGIMLSYKMNGEMLRPDHGKPLRAVVPGQIGGRSVKWLKKLIVTDAPSDNWYHIYDNRVLPTMVSPEESAKDTKWWTDERYAIYDLSPNSAICYPAHDEKLSLLHDPQRYRGRGYAYSGGGRRITRVEISVDKGTSWRLADIDYPEDRYRDVEKLMCGGRLDMSWRESCFCWCQWSLELDVAELKGAKDMLVRAMDESMNMQPRDMYWSVLGMMNNPWFRVTIINEGDFLRFEHPTLPGYQAGGWMERVKKDGGNLLNGYWGESIGEQDIAAPTTEVSQISMVQKDLKNFITIEDLRKHDNKDSPWFVVDGEVYDGTKFLKGHPGGATSIISAAGVDSTDEFMAIRMLSPQFSNMFSNWLQTAKQQRQ